MFKYVWDNETGGLLLTTDTTIQGFNNEPRPVYYKELDILGFDQHWNYPKDDSAPLMWSENNNYIYRGKLVAKTKGGSVFSPPEIIILSDPESDNAMLKFVNVDRMVEKNEALLEALVQETIQKIYNYYRESKDNVDVFYVAFSGGKDSIVALDLVQRALPHDEFLVLFGDTRMEFPDTYHVVEQVKAMCQNEGIRFLTAQSRLTPDQTWNVFGPPSTSNRWCCSVHKTSPQINLLRQITGKSDFTGMAFTGIRSAESQQRSEYDEVSSGKKHTGQLSCHGILEWNSAEIYLYIFSRKLILNETYKLGIPRAGCLVCPNSSGRHEYIKQVCYHNETSRYLEYIATTSNKTNYTPEEMKDFIDSGYWRTRRTGRELNFGQDSFEVRPDIFPPEIIVFKPDINWKLWKLWMKTIGEFYESEENLYVIKYLNKLYQIRVDHTKTTTTFILLNCKKSKEDIKFFSLFRGVIVKTLYCIGCGVCEAECKSHCIKMSNGIEIGDNCTHCYKCQDIHEHCLRYNSIRNKITEGKRMSGLDRYFSFGARADWMKIFCDYNGSNEFWISDGNGLVANKKKDAFKNFLTDAGMVVYDKNAEGDKYTKCIPTFFAQTIFRIGSESPISWALILCNLSYTPTYNWFIRNLKQGVSYTPDSIKSLLADVMENDLKGLGKRNVVDSLKVAVTKTPLGTSKIFADYDASEKVTLSGKETVTLNSITRCKWKAPVAEVILYSLYKFAEECGDYYQFTLKNLMDESIERDGISPTLIYGLDREDMIPILNGLSVNYPDFISASFTLNLDTITLRPSGEEFSSEDVLRLF